MRPSVLPFAATSKLSAFAFGAMPPVLTQSMADTTKITMNLLGLPFDIVRAQYARAVQLGLIERSMLASRDFSRTVGALEQLTLGPWARHV